MSLTPGNGKNEEPMNNFEEITRETFVSWYNSTTKFEIRLKTPSKRHKKSSVIGTENDTSIHTVQQVREGF